MTPWHHVPKHTRGSMLAYELLSDCTDTFEWEGETSPPLEFRVAPPWCSVALCRLL